MISFKQWCIENNALVLLELYENASNVYKSDEIAFSSLKEVNLKCKKCGMSWKEELRRVTQRIKRECPYCNHERASEKYNVITECPILKEEWNYELNLYPPTQYLPNSNKKVWWKCKNGHKWLMSICNINKMKSKEKCPYCRKLRA